MKVLYLAEWDAFASSGVIRKIKAQYDTWRSLGIDAQLVIVSPRGGSRTKPLINGDGITVITHASGRCGLGKIYKAQAIRKAKKLVVAFSPDVIYYRQSSWTPGILGLLDLGKVVVAEINSNDSTEIHQYGWLKARYHLATRSWLVRRVRGFVCVGNDATVPYRKYGKPIAVIGNGFDTAAVVPRGPTGNLRPQLVFVGSAGQVWHGLDKILAMAAKLPEFDFHVVGDTLSDAPKNVYSHGHVDWTTLDGIYRKMDVGIASLALHRIQVDEISPLKTREYLGYGLPVIGAYDDPDLEGCAFFLRLPNEENGVRKSLGSITEFVRNWHGRPIDMHWVRARIDSRVKERLRIDFIEEIFRQQAAAEHDR